MAFQFKALAGGGEATGDGLVDLGEPDGLRIEGMFEGESNGSMSFKGAPALR